MTRPFKSELIIEEKISEATLRAYHVGYDQNKFRLKELVDVIRNVIPEFVLGYPSGTNVPLAEAADKLKEAALTVYTTDKYQNRGEFGELILHLLLRDFCNTVPLLSKMAFKDSPNCTIHGFDGVHVTTDKGQNKLWLGESKLYGNGQAGVKDLAQDVKNHFKADYLRSEFELISRKLPADFPNVEYWRQLIDKHQKLDTIFAAIIAPMVCTYSSDTCKNHSSETKVYLQDFIKECKGLQTEFNNGLTVKTNFEVILLLLPVPSKNDLAAELDKRLKSMQNL